MKTRMCLFTFPVPKGLGWTQELDQAKDAPIITDTPEENSGNALRGLGYINPSGWGHGAFMDKASGKA